MSNLDSIHKSNIAIVILTWNGLALTRRCLSGLVDSSGIDEVCIVVVDNGSTDGTLQYLKALKNIILVENGENLGYAKAVNLGINAAPPDSDIILLNNDIEIIDKSWLRKLIESANISEKIGVMGVKILQDSETLQHCGAYLPLDTYWGQQIAGNEQDIGQYAGIIECESVVFACVYIKRKVIREVGMLNERFFAYFEDTDYCLRVSRAGYKVVMNGDVRIRHFENSSTEINKVSHSDIFLKSQNTFKEIWGETLSRERYSKGMLDFHSIINFPSGYAASARSMVEALDCFGVKLAYKYVYGPGTVFPVVEPTHSDSYVVNMVRSRPFGKAIHQVVYAQGDVFERNSGKYKIGYTMLEVNGLPGEWVRQANKMNEVWVPSEFNKQTFINSGVRVPIHIVPLGVDTAYFNPSIAANRIDGQFTFFSIFEWGERKAPDLLLKAFSDEFNRDEDVVLVCKVNNFDPSVNVQKQVSALQLRKNGGRIRIAMNHILKRYELGVLYRSADCFVLPTRGEGWGMPILEAMACGLPAIATNWSSQVDFMTKDNSLPLEVEKLVPAIAKCPYYRGFEWAEPSYEHLRTLMRWVYENQESAKKIGAVAARNAAEKWSWISSAKVIQQRITCSE